LNNADKIMMNTFWIGVWPGISEKALYYVLEQFESFK